MLLPDNVHPELSIYYNGALVLRILNQKKCQTVVELFWRAKSENGMSFPTFVLSLDWLYLVEVAQANEKGVIKKINREPTLDKDFENDLAQLDSIKCEIIKASSRLSKLNIRKNIILEAKTGMEQDLAKIDLSQLEMLYNEVSYNIVGIQKTFDDLVSYHNAMLVEKVKFITAELPDLLEKIQMEEALIKELREKEKEFTQKVSKSDFF